MGYWKRNLEYEKKLLNELPEGLKKVFQEKLNKSKIDYWKILSEVRAIVVFIKKLGLQSNGIKSIDVKAFKNKDVDFVVCFENNKIYIEVKSFNPDDQVAEQGIEVFGPDSGNEKISRALRRSKDKFLENCCNIVVIADEDTQKLSLLGRNQDLSRFFQDEEYEKISAVMILGKLGEVFDFESSPFLSGPAFTFQLSYNERAQKKLPKNLTKILDEKKVVFPSMER